MVQDFLHPPLYTLNSDPQLFLKLSAGLEAGGEAAKGDGHVKQLVGFTGLLLRNFN